MIKLVCFDIGGTLFDYKSYNNFIKSLSEEFSVSQDEIRRDYNKYLKLNNKEVKSFIYEDVVPALKMLIENNFKLGIVSNAIYKHVFTLEELGIAEYFDFIVYSFDTGSKKPYAGIFRFMEEMSGLEAGEICLIGDSLKSDIRGANEAGWLSIYLNRLQCCYQEMQYIPKYMINDFEHISDLLNEYNKNKLSI